MQGIVLISGNGSNLQSIIDKAKEISLSIKCVISNNPNAYGLKRAEIANIPTNIIDDKLFDTRESFNLELLELIDSLKPQIIILAGYMRILSEEIISKYQGMILNIHPSLLPKYTGLNTHKKAILAKEKFHGASVHFVTKELDKGPIILQKKIAINYKDGEEKIAKQVLNEEHLIYPQAIKWYTKGRLKFIDENTIKLDNKKIKFNIS